MTRIAPLGRHAPSRDRAVSAVLGAILVFGFLVAVLSVIQLGSVPVWNAGTEVEHSRQVQAEFQQFDAAVRRSVVEDSPATAVVTLGTDYPIRPFLYNPAPASGRLSTSGAGTLSVANVDVSGEADYPPPAGNTISGESQLLTYQPRYNEYTGAPVTRYEHGVLVREYDGSVRLLGDDLLADDRITLTAVRGDLNRTGVAPESVAVEPLSAPMRTVTVTNASAGPLVVRVPTGLSEATWEEYLSAEYASNGGHIVGDDAGVTVADGVLTVELEPGVSYELRLGAVGLGSETEAFAPRYLSTDTPSLLLRPLGGSTLDIRVYDRFNNPVGGVPVTFAAEDGLLGRSRVVTDESGRATVQYTAPAANGSTAVTVTMDRDGDGDTTDDGEQLTIPVTVLTVDDREDDIAAVNPAPGAERVRLVSATSDGPNASLTFDNDASSDLRMAAVRVSYYFSDDTTPPPPTGTFSYAGYQRQLTIPGEFAAVQGPDLAADGGTGETATVTIDSLKNNLKGDFMFLSVRYVDPAGEGYTTTYIVTIPD
ncbi:Ig-like domain-containing protein [Haloglomus litoreum]|uniref:Ig-like domain-containing protein n=1 Tax=Haloglomus litoreum TaxID=3034026 RepID=UPI0023E77EB1|nr:Ig-like domain-containing protein [Haloglomus sp. DT116]